MPLNEDQICFPNNIVNVLAAALQEIDPDEPENDYEGVRIFKRPLDRADGDRSVSVVAVNWRPIMGSKEMGKTAEPILQEYYIVIQVMVADGEEQRAIATHSLLSTRVRHMLYRSPALAVVLPQLEVEFSSIGGMTLREHLVKWDVTTQNFMNHEMGGMFVYLASLELRFTTTIV